MLIISTGLSAQRKIEIFYLTDVGVASSHNIGLKPKIYESENIVISFEIIPTYRLL